MNKKNVIKEKANIFQRMLEDKRAIRRCIQKGEELKKLAKQRGIKFLHPYKIAEEADLTNSFTTGITYHAYFLDYSCYHPDFANVYTFNIEPEQDTPHPIDKRIALTVIHILRQFFSRNENAMIMICDNLDGKEQKREMLFSRWFMQYNEEAYGNTMLRQLRMITCCMYLCSCIGTTQMPDSLSMLFIIW